MATELEVDSTRSEEEQIKIAVMALYDEDKGELVEWAIEVIFVVLIYVLICLKAGVVVEVVLKRLYSHLVYTDIRFSRTVSCSESS